MSVKSFKFVSPGVFINEIDNSFLPESAEAIGPVVIGRAQRGLAMQPVTVQSYSEFVNMFGDTVPGNGGGDVYRDGNLQSPMYGTYAAKAFLNANVAPLTYVRLLGTETSVGDTAGGDASAGWKTTNTISTTALSNGGAYGLFVWPSSSAADIGYGTLGAIWYINSGSTIELSGTFFDGQGSGQKIQADSHLITTDSNGMFKVVISGSNGTETVQFDFDDSKETFVRKRFSTNPQLCSTAGTFYPAASIKDYWLGETFTQELRDGAGQSLGDLTTNNNLIGIILGIGQSGSSGVGSADPSQMKGQETTEGRAGWFIGQDLGAAASWIPESSQKLFRLIGRGHGEWLPKNLKVSIEKVRQSTTTTNDDGTFSVVLRNLLDTDNKVEVVERFDNLTLDPTSPDYVARKLGDTYMSWDSTSRRLKSYGEYPSKSKFVYVQMNSDVDAGATDATYLPFGYFGPPTMINIAKVSGSGNNTTGSFMVGGANVYNGNATYLGSGSSRPTVEDGRSAVTASFTWPAVRLRNSASDGGLSDPTNAFFGFDVTRLSSSTRPDASVADGHRLWYNGFPDDPGPAAIASGIMVSDFVFSLLKLIKTSDSPAAYYYESGSRVAGNAVASSSYVDLLNAGYDRFTAPFWGAADGVDIRKPDPFYNKGMAASSTEDNSYIYNTYRRAIDTVADPEFINMNLLTAPGLTNDSLTVHMINVCEERGDALSVIDLANVYIPSHEQYYSAKSSRIGTNPTNASNDLRDRRIDSSYGCTFYPWVQTRDESSGQLLWIPPSVAMLGVFASSERASQVWFAPAGFNRGGLTDGAAGIPVANVTERLISKDRDLLYEAGINPIASFPSSGIVVFGQKTLQERRSALDRINVRRLVIYLKKQISILSTQVLFEQNVQATWLRFKALINPFLSTVMTQYGITDYRLILDESTTTPDLIDQNIMYAKIMVKPARAIEYIAIDFVITSTGASFDD
jgi:hypothetical protein